MKKIIKSFCMMALCGVVVSTAACSDDNDPQVDQIVPVLAFSNVDAEGIVLSDIGSTATVQVSLTPADLPDIDKYFYRFVSANENVFTVTDDGIVTAVGQGVANLTAYSPNNTQVSASCKVTVVGKLMTSIKIDDAAREISFDRDRTYPTFDLGQYITIEPADVTNPVLRYISSDESKIRIDENGLVKAFGQGTVTIRVEAADGSGVYDEAVAKISGYDYFEIDREGWSVPDTSAAPVVSGISGSTPEALIDDPAAATALLLVKQGKSQVDEEGETFTGPVSPDRPYFVLDMGAQTTFNCLTVMHYADATSNNYRTTGGTLYGSNDGSAFTELQNVTWSNSGTAQIFLKLDDDYNYRYVKVELNTYNTSGNYLLIRDFRLYEYTYEENTFD